MDRAFRGALPGWYAHHLAAVVATGVPRNLLISRTGWSTGIVNRAAQFTAHRDCGNLAGGIEAVTFLRQPTTSAAAGFQGRIMTGFS